MDTDLSLIIPAYNEEDGIGKVLDETLEYLTEHGKTWELIVVDDGSNDGTYEQLQTRSEKISVIRHRRNRGYGASLKTGIKHAKSDWIAILDADGTYPINRLNEMVTKAKEEHCDMVVGSRTGKHVRIPLVRKPAKWVLRQLASALSGTSIPDLNSGMRVFKKQTIELYLAILPDSFSFTTTSTIAMLCDNRSVGYISIDYYSRSGSSKIRPIRDTYRFTMLILRTTIYFEPLRIFAPLAFMLMALSCLLILYRAVVHQAFEVTSAVLFMVGVHLLAMGLLADLINRRSKGLSMEITKHHSNPQ